MHKHLLILFSVSIFHFSFLPACSAKPDTRVFEMRTYHAAPGKLDALHARSRDHTCALFEKHGITNIGYWVPLENEGNILTYIVAYPERKARETSWKAFKNDPDWKTAYAASTKDGKIVQKVDSTFMQLTDYSPALPKKLAEGKEMVELRTYTTNPGKLPNINARFREHTCALFEKHGITNLAYFNLMEDQDKADVTLVYLVVHDDVETRNASFKAFGSDPAWKKAAAESQVDGKILIKGGVNAINMKATDYSPL